MTCSRETPISAYGRKTLSAGGFRHRSKGRAGALRYEKQQIQRPIQRAGQEAHPTPAYGTRRVMAFIGPGTVKTVAWAVTLMPRDSAVAVVMGPMEATSMPRSRSGPPAATKFWTVEE